MKRAAVALFGVLGTCIAGVALIVATYTLFRPTFTWLHCSERTWESVPDPQLLLVVLPSTAVACGPWILMRNLAKSSHARLFNTLSWAFIISSSLFVFLLYAFAVWPYSEEIEGRIECGVSPVESAVMSLVLFMPLLSVVLLQVLCPAKPRLETWRPIVSVTVLIIGWAVFVFLPVGP